MNRTILLIGICFVFVVLSSKTIDKHYDVGFNKLLHHSVEYDTQFVISFLGVDTNIAKNISCFRMNDSCVFLKEIDVIEKTVWGDSNTKTISYYFNQNNERAINYYLKYLIFTNKGEVMKHVKFNKDGSFNTGSTRNILDPP